LARPAGLAHRRDRSAARTDDAFTLEHAGAGGRGDRRLAAVLLGEQRAILARDLGVQALHRRRLDVTLPRERLLLRRRPRLDAATPPLKLTRLTLLLIMTVWL
jgi:hypothetical protein